MEVVNRGTVNSEILYSIHYGHFLSLSPTSETCISWRGACLKDQFLLPLNNHLHLPLASQSFLYRSDRPLHVTSSLHLHYLIGLAYTSAGMAFTNVVKPTDTRPLSQYTKTNKPARTGLGQFVTALENGVSAPPPPHRTRKSLTS